MLKEQIINQIDTLDTEELMLIYGYIESLKSRTPRVESARNDAHLLVREALKGLKTSLSEDILAARAERL